MTRTNPMGAATNGARIEMSSMTRNPPEGRTPEQVRAASRRLAWILVTIAVAFFGAIVVKQWLFGGG